MRNNIKILLVSALLASACSLEVPDLNNPSLDSLENNPTPSAFRAAAVGLILGNRLDYAEANGYISILGILGRESYNFDPADPRYISELLAGENLDAGSPRFGGNFWSAPYRNIRNANVLLNALEKDKDRETPVFTAEGASAMRGFAHTMQAFDFLMVINTRDDHGAAIDVNRARGAGLAPIASKTEVFEHIVSLLEQGHTELQAGSVPFTLPSGFTNVSMTAFNRALMARVHVYRGDYFAALTALEGSFLHVDAADPQLDLGVYHTYGTGNGDRLNGLVDNNIFVHPSIFDTAESNAVGDPDLRVAAKIFTKPEARRVQDLESQLGFASYQAPVNPTAPAPIIRNEELVLLRAEARSFTGDLPGAIEDINYVRTVSGGLPPRDDLTAENFVDELLTQRKFSLLFEGGHRWLDMRRFDRLAALPVDADGHRVHTSFPIPVAEIDAR